MLNYLDIVLYYVQNSIFSASYSLQYTHPSTRLSLPYPALTVNTPISRFSRFSRYKKSAFLILQTLCPNNRVFSLFYHYYYGHIYNTEPVYIPDASVFALFKISTAWVSIKLSFFRSIELPIFVTVPVPLLEKPPVSLPLPLPYQLLIFSRVLMTDTTSVII